MGGPDYSAQNRGFREVFKGVFRRGRERRLYTLSLAPSKSHFDEDLIKTPMGELREWRPERSKLAAALLNGMKNMAIKPSAKVLYLGASHGYTPSFVSDIIGKKGFLFALDFSPEVVRRLVLISKERENMAPLLENAVLPAGYTHRVSRVDVIYQDVAQPNQVEILMKNVDIFLRRGGTAYLALKARSIDFSEKPKAVFKRAGDELKRSFEILEEVPLAPFEKDHMMFVVRKR